MGKILLFFIIAAATFTTKPAAADIVIRLACGSSDPELSTCISNADAWVKERSTDTAVSVKIIPVPDYTDVRRIQYETTYYPCSAGELPQKFCNGDDYIDVYPIDIIWPSYHSKNFIDFYATNSALDDNVRHKLSERLQGCDIRLPTQNATCTYAISLIKNNTVDEHLVAIPAFADGGMLYSRIDLINKHHQSLQQYVYGRVKGASNSQRTRCVKLVARDLRHKKYLKYLSIYAILEKLENFKKFVDNWDYDQWDWTWDDLTSVAKYIQEAERCEGNTQVWGLIWQGKTPQQRISTALEWIGSKAAPENFTDNSWILKYCPHDEFSSDWQAVSDGIKMAHKWIWQDEISPLTVLSYGNKESEAMFESGKAVFMRHWPSTWAVLRKKRELDGNIVVTYLPRSNRGTAFNRLSTLGGWELAVSKKSKHQSEAVDLTLFLTGYDRQKRNAITGVFRPTINELYEDAFEIKRQIGKYNGMFDDPKRAHVISALRPANPSDLKWCKSPASAGSSGADEPIAGERAAAQAKQESEAGAPCFDNYFEWSDCFSAVLYDMLSDRDGVSTDKLQRIGQNEGLCKCKAKAQ